VHDYLNEFGGAERVLLALSEIFPKAPIYTAFYRKDSPAYERFKNKKIVTSWAQNVPFFSSKLHSPLRFLAPFIWNRFDFSEYDLVISSASWYVTKGFGRRTINNQQSTINNHPIEICYCHTPPRYLYGYKTSIEWRKHFLVRVYALLVNHFMRVYDFEAAQPPSRKASEGRGGVDYFIANSKEVAARIKKFYRRESKVIYPPVDLPLISKTTKAKRLKHEKALDISRSSSGDYFLVVSRIVGGKGLRLAVETANKLGINLKVVGKPVGYASEYKDLQEIAGNNVEFYGYVSDKELSSLYGGARAFMALATDEDFGITPVEAMLCGTPVIAYRGGGYLETVIDEKTGVFFSPNTKGALTLAINKFMKLEKQGKFDSNFIKKHARKFSKERFKKEILKFVEERVKHDPKLSYKT
jgi:glycosyltransferase involved in cell wall biosynthesis